MPDTPQLPPFDVEKEHLYFELDLITVLATTTVFFLDFQLKQAPRCKYQLLSPDQCSNFKNRCIVDNQGELTSVHKLRKKERTYCILLSLLYLSSCDTLAFHMSNPSEGSFTGWIGSCNHFVIMATELSVMVKASGLCSRHGFHAHRVDGVQSDIGPAHFITQINVQSYRAISLNAWLLKILYCSREDRNKKWQGQCWKAHFITFSKVRGTHCFFFHR